ncbi:MAG TPA: hypothetical protein ENO08_08730 [Candidatus Eisenbacteria bacterium]|uniref:Uncharacterized protein n=1 Tax=Eiseniibacteriota bacterium TaxID=2212470 RepID=A0A7V2AWH3_UNCEI|nr:hypothetical protein [Candidatus Eisenbacteria bacterium]
MKRMLILAFVIPLVLYACFDSDDPAEPDGNNGDVSPYSGIFACSCAFVESDCSYPAPGPPSTLDVLIDGDVITIEGEVGVWAENTLTGIATSAETCVPVGPPLDCVRCFYYTFWIEYASPDSFSGTYTVVYPYSADCGTDECSTVYDIEGVR